MEQNRTASYRGYPEAYSGPLAIEVQIKKAAQAFGLDPKQALERAGRLAELPSDAEGWFAIPSPGALGESYAAAIQRFAEVSGLDFDLPHGAGLGDIQLDAMTASVLEMLAEQQSGDILIVPAQLGFARRGESNQYVCKSFVDDEFGLDVIAVGTIALLHPKRFFHWEADLDMGCPGNTVGDLVPALALETDLELVVKTRHTAFHANYCGSATGFLPTI